MYRITPDETNVKLLGRTYTCEDGVWCALSASGIEFSVTGTYCKVTLEADERVDVLEESRYARVGIFVDGILAADERLTEPSMTFTAFKGDEERTAVVRVIKLSGSTDSTMGIQKIETDASKIVPTAKKQKRIEFIGDSITCGYGVEGTLENLYSTEYENTSKAYAYLTAQALDVDYSLVSFSGHGLISGYTDDDKIINLDCLVQPYYEKLGRSGGMLAKKVLPQDVDWDFERFVPDVVVINLGTNDASYCKDEDRCKGYQKEYIQFLKTVRSKNPRAKILCTLGVMGDELYPDLKAAVAQYEMETDDHNVDTYHFTAQDIENGYGVDYHPCEANQIIAAKELTQKLREIL